MLEILQSIATNSWYVTIGIAVILFIIGFCKGTLRMMVSLTSVALAGIATYIATPIIAPKALSLISPTLKGKLVEGVGKLNEAVVNGVPALEKLKLPSESSQVAFGSFLAEPVLSAIVFFIIGVIIFCLIKSLSSMLLSIIYKLEKLPFIRMLSKVLEGVALAVCGVLVWGIISKAVDISIILESVGV